jgi:hypothetical protein
MSRTLAAALALVALAGCHSEDELTIINAGAEPVLADLEWRRDSTWDWNDRRHRLVEIPAGGIYSDDVGQVAKLNVLIFRKSDGLVLLSDDFEADDFDDDHGHIEITVTP